MPVATRALRKRQINMRSGTFTLRSAERIFRRIIEQAKEDEVVTINRDSRFFRWEVTTIGAIPIRPPGYFANCYTKAEIRDDNRLAKSSVIRVPEDLE
jgi:hypothetical protein